MNHTGNTPARYNEQSTVAQYQDARGYGYPPRSSVDANALGNLAYASTLGQGVRAGTRDNSSLQQLINYNRSQYGNDYDTAQSHGQSHTNYDYSNQRADTRSSTTLQENNARDPQPAQAQHSAQYQYGHYATTAGYTSPIPAYSTQEEGRRVSNAVGFPQRVNTEQGQKNQHYYSDSQPPRPSSGQNYRTGSSTASSQARRSPAVAPYQVPRPQSSSKASDHIHSQFSQSPSQTTPQQSYQTAKSAQLSRAQAQGSKQGSISGSAVRPRAKQSNDPLRGSDRDHSSNQPETSTTSEDQIQTVDPSDVFNHYEYQRRQAAAAAEVERVRKEAEADEMRKASEAAAALKRVSEGQQHTLANGNVSSSELRKEEQMAAEMRLMIEKMRDYKAQDPSLFSQIWEQVKKTQPAGSVPAAPPLSAKEMSGSTPVPQNQINSADVSSTFQIDNGDSSDKLPDLGRFPFQRRQRGSKTDSPVRTPKGGSSKKKQNKPSPTDGLQSSPLTNAITTEASTAPGNSDRQVVYVSGTGPAATASAVNGASSSSAAVPQPPGLSNSRPVVQPPNPQGGTTWPEHKKWDLAVAAKNTLLANPINSAQARNITPDQILGFLNQNPSFEQLCRMIEAKGLIIERSHFARSLLEAIPDIGAGARQRQQQQQSQQRPALANRQPPAEPIGAQVNGDEHALQKPQLEGAPVAQMVTTPHGPKLPHTTPSEEKASVPLTKQELARKRTIADIIDLSQLSDDDDHTNPPGMLRPNERPQMAEDGQLLVPQANGHAPGPQANLPHQPNAAPDMYITAPLYPPPSFMPFYQPHPPLHNPSSSSGPHMPAPAPVLSPSAIQRELITSEDIVKPIDKHRAKKRSRYKSSTIVRDVLIAAARHPTMQPLNYHLESLRTTFKHVNDMSDLSTFRWDLVDPGVPIDFTALEDEPADIDDTNDADDEGIRDVVTLASPRIQHTTNGDTEMPTAVAPSSIIQHHFSNPPKLRGPKRKRAIDQPRSNIEDSPTGFGLDRIRATPTNQSSPRTPKLVIPGTENGFNSTYRRRGRPPGAKNKNPRKSGTNMPSYTRIDTTPARPSNLRNTVVPTNGVAVVVPSPSPSIAETRRPGRPRKKSPRTSQQSSPIHRVYKCRWSNCPAELHNLDTLRKHVMKHGDNYDEENDHFPCLWRGCGRAVQGDDEGDNEEVEHQPLRFATRETWAKHMDKRHVADYAWKLGDGPSARSDSDMSDYVSDSAKRPVRPIITKEGRDKDPIPLTNDNPEREYYKAHGITTELEKAQAIMEANEARRRKLGPGMDRVGATLVTERTRELLNDELAGLTKVETERDT
ncbi:MAG: hypothetical protein Q9220_001682 [cf. Caloplaca sp. 1 TL-2023]